MDLETSLASTLDAMGTNLDQASPEQLFCALLRVTRDVELKQKPAQGDRKLYYFSAEFLIGRLLRANLQNLGLLDDAERILAEHGTSLAEVEDREPEPSLGNGGLGRLAACFLDSIASLTRQIEGVQVGITITENKDGTSKISVRTTKEVDASAICAKCGGGGHLRAGGASLPCAPDAAREQILEAARQVYAESELAE